ncbi:MAG: methyl-accepting chemotaxis protein [Methylococcales bacterium]|nr:methyl-accepting chemotaxis protein [Methylococcales bacterium]MDD5753384.1 methyl-accepting chemotaxis protein [Methylococcales bacterium]
MTIQKKLWLIIGLAVTAILVVAGTILFSKQEQMMEDRKHATRFAVETAWGIMESLDKSVAAGEISLENAKKQAIHQIKFMRYDGKEYFWLNDLHPNMIMHPTKPEFDGKDISEFKDPNGKMFFTEMVKVVRANGQGFVDYKWPRPDSKEPVPKISFVKNYAPWGWVVGSGVYVDDIDIAIRNDALKLGGLVLAIACLIGTIVILLARSISFRLEKAVLIAQAVSEGKFNNVIENKGADEISGVLISLDKMQQHLQERQDAALVASNEMARLKCVLDDVEVCVRVADMEGKVIYINHIMRDTLRKYEKEFQQDIPNFRADEMVGGSIGILYPDPKAAIERMRNLTETTKTEFKFGGRQFDVLTTPVFSDSGVRLGSVAQWIDCTDQIKSEEEIAAIVHSASLGDFNHRIPLEGKQGLSLQLAESMNELMATTSASLEEIVRVLSALAQGDLTEMVSGNYQGTFGKLKTDANTTIGQLTDIISQIKASSDAIQVAAKEISSGNNDLARRTEEQAASLQETAASMEELSVTVKQNTDNAKHANDLALGAAGTALKGVEVVNTVVSTMSSINESSHQIVDIISVIDDIAFQTNILALNAAVEAARAGEQGLGFAVVAIEVRNLAQRAASAAGEIKRLISDSVERISGGSKQVEQAGITMQEIVNSIRQVTELMSNIAAASIQQNAGIGQVYSAIVQMDGVTQQNAALVGKAEKVTESLNEQTQNLAVEMLHFKTGV